MANRSFFYLKNDRSSRILSEGVYQIPLFWQCLWASTDLTGPIENWKTAFSLVEREGEEALVAFLETAQLDILVSQDAYRRNAQGNRTFVESVFPEQLALYDQFLAFVDSNIRPGDRLGFDVTEIVDMGEPEEAEAELLANQKAIAEPNKDLLGPNSLYGDSIYADFTGYTDFYLKDLAEANRLVTDDRLLEDQAEVETSAAPDQTQSAIEGGQTQQPGTRKFKWGIILLVILLVRLILKFLV